jgi:hypothetical protein
MWKASSSDYQLNPYQLRYGYTKSGLMDLEDDESEAEP